jgi:hypothetical protein
VADVPQIPPRLTDPVPVLTIGILGWIVALVVFTATGDRSDDAMPDQHVAGFALFLAQRAASRRGSRTAQRGLD